MERRTFLAGAAKAGAALTVGAPFIAPRLSQAAATISVVSWGGSYGEFLKEYWAKPFTAETGIGVQFVAGPDLARVRAQVSTNNIEWDVFDAPGALTFAGAKAGLWETIDTKLIDPGRFVKWPTNNVLVPTYIYAGGIGYHTDQTKNPAKTFAELWDVKNFPGRRALRARASETMEIALIADGVEPAKLYPLDIERAFKSLERIKPHVKKWFTETAQGVTLLQTKEVEYTNGYLSRIKVASESGVPVNVSMNQLMAGQNYFAITKGTKKKAEAMKFLEFITRQKQQQELPKVSGVGAIKDFDFGLLTEAERRWTPNLKGPQHTIVNDEFWADHFIDVDKRFKEWILT